jgi:hypothetical protein
MACGEFAHSSRDTDYEIRTPCVSRLRDDARSERGIYHVPGALGLAHLEFRPIFRRNSPLTLCANRLA